MKFKSVMSVFILMVGLMLSLPVVSKAEGWVKDINTGCSFWTASDLNAGTWAGDCVEGKASGNGILTLFKDNKVLSTYVGGMKEGKLNGKMEAKSEDGERYVGQFKEGYYDGQGTLFFEDGSRYIGEFKDGNYDGQGTLNLADGSRYVGQFKDSNYDGQGTLTYGGGSRYVGQFKDNNYDGHGVYTESNGERYVGQFKNSNYDGEGIYTLPDGSRYAGHFKDSNYDGQGKFTNADGSVFHDGLWVNGEPDIENKGLIFKALASEDAGNIQAAIELHKKILESQPQNVSSINSIAGLYGTLGKFDEEIFWAKKAIDTEPTYDKAYLNYGNALSELGRIAEAKKAFEKAVELNPNSPVAFYSLGVLAEQTRDIPQAIKYYKKSVEVDPKFENGYFNLGLGLANLKQYDEAISTIKKLLTINPDHADASKMLNEIERAKKSKFVKCEIHTAGKMAFSGKCIFTPDINGSFSLSDFNEKPLLEGILIVSVTLMEKGIAEVSALTINGNNSRWGTAKRSSKDKACWLGSDFKICAR